MTVRQNRPTASVSLLIWDGQRVFLVRRDGTRGLFPHAWTLPGNPLQRDETAKSGAARVCRDALGIVAERVLAVRELGEPSPFRQDRGPDTVMRVVSWSGEPAARLANWDRGGWFSIKDMAKLRMLREGRELIAAECERLQPTESRR
jgi:ADP-ribose pyrophosphatase YjhB (NUDIX family)